MGSFNCALLIFIFTITISLTTATDTTVSNSVVKAAYWTSWSIDHFPPSSIDTTLFTHIYYAFISPNNITFKFDISNSDTLLLKNFTTTLRHKNPPVKTLVSIGGGIDDPKLYARMVSTPQSRKAFIDSTIEVARKFGLDGLDLDWESPEDPQQMRDLGRLFREWRLAIRKEARASKCSPILLTAAVYFSVDFFTQEVYRKYPVKSINRNLDWVSPMCYDYKGAWDTSETGAHAALYDPSSNVSTSYGLQSWINTGVSPSKIVMGLPLYGKSWTLKDPNLNGLGAPAVGVGPRKGILTFSQLEHFNRNYSAKVVYDAVTVSTYSYVGTTWIGYDDTTSTLVKIAYAKAHGLRGYFFWAVTFDDDWKISRRASGSWVEG